MLMDTKTFIRMLVNTKELNISQTKLVEKIIQYKTKVWNNVYG